MLSRPARLNEIATHRYGWEVKWDGFRAIVGLNGELRVRSRRGWDMTALVAELRAIPAEGVFDGELVAFAPSGHPSWPLLCRRVLNRDGSELRQLTDTEALQEGLTRTRAQLGLLLFLLSSHDSTQKRNVPTSRFGGFQLTQ
jgi:ATP-dependent DNA ligase